MATPLLVLQMTTIRTVPSFTAFSPNYHLDVAISDFEKFQELSYLKIDNQSKPQFLKMFSKSLLLVGATSLVSANIQLHQNVLPAQPVMAPIANGLGQGAFQENTANWVAQKEDDATDLAPSNSAMSKYVPDVIEGYNARKPAKTSDGPPITLKLGRIIKELHDLGDAKVKEILNHIVTGFDRVQSETSNAFISPMVKAKAWKSAIENADIESILGTLRGASSEVIERALRSSTAFLALLLYCIIIKSIGSYLLPKTVKPTRLYETLVVPNFIEIAFVEENFSNHPEIDPGSPQIFFNFKWLAKETSLKKPSMKKTSLKKPTPSLKQK
ncbi:hypothetical protein ROZALSC1DRAFT_23393 [Rozella allomycis CSF55]|uniref:Uncharacterized protein n=1 Tax=Rozella allomycis (strain CSF55) TaxID=988480 RepID=A0A4P9YG77_ROZAC|nr:hypothetical protein ROZALSC1DRAFT_23393 [Rozella allomycis CSF55]